MQIIYTTLAIHIAIKSYFCINLFNLISQPHGQSQELKIFSDQNKLPYLAIIIIVIIAMH